jgi:hypothetical protein
MTVWKAFHIRRRNGGPNSRLIQTFLREGWCSIVAYILLFLISQAGVFYYILISIANLVNYDLQIFFLSGTEKYL